MQKASLCNMIRNAILALAKIDKFTDLLID